MSRKNDTNSTVVRVTHEKESLLEWIWDLVCCWLIAMGSALLQDAQIPFSTGLSAVWWQTLLTVALVMFFTRKLLYLFFGVGVTGLGLGLFVTLTHFPLQDKLNTLWELLMWWFMDAKVDEKLLTEENYYLLHIFFNVSIALLMLLAVRVTKRALVPTVVCVVVYLIALMYGNTENSLLTILLYVAGCFPLIARDQYVGRRLFSKKDKYTAMGKRGSVVSIASVFCIAIAALMLRFLPTDMEQLRTRLAADWTADLQTITGLFTEEQRSAETPTLRDLGLQPYRTKLGGTYKKPESVILAVTDATQEQLMRVTSYETFTGKKWKKSFSKAYRVDGPWDKTTTSMLSALVLGDSWWGPQLNQHLTPATTTVTLKSDSFVLPTTGLTLNLTENESTKNPVLVNTNGEVFSYHGFKEGYSYTLDSVTYPLDTAYLPYEAFSMFHDLGETQKDAYYEDILETYTQLPKKYSQTARDLAAEIAGDYNFAEQKAYALARYFSKDNGFTYMEKVGTVSDKDNVVDLLLTEKKGYCVYYATAMSTMARSLGIPSRIAAGYKTAWSNADAAYVIDTASPYCWTECYFKSLGWVAFDPSPEAIRQPKPEEKDKQDDKDKQMETAQLDDMPEAVSWNTEDDSVWWTLAVILLLVLFVVIRTLMVPSWYKLKSVKKRYRTSTQRAEFYYWDILRQFALMGYRHEKGETVPETVRRLRDTLKEEDLPVIASALEPVAAWHYGQLPVTEEELDALAQVHETLENRVWRRTNTVKYFIIRRLLRPMLCYGAFKTGLQMKARMKKKQ